MSLEVKRIRAALARSAHRFLVSRRTLTLSDLTECNRVLRGLPGGDARIGFRRDNLAVTFGDRAAPYSIDHRLLRNEAVGWVDAFNETKHHEWQKVAKLLAWFWSIHPFADGNGRLGRLLVGVRMGRTQTWPGLHPAGAALRVVDTQARFEALQEWRDGKPERYFALWQRIQLWSERLALDFRQPLREFTAPLETVGNHSTARSFRWLTRMDIHRTIPRKHVQVRREIGALQHAGYSFRKSHCGRYLINQSLGDLYDVLDEITQRVSDDVFGPYR